MGKAFSAIKNGIIDENPTFIQVLGTCPALAVTTGAVNGIGMGLSTMAVLACSNLFISLLRNIIPDTVRIPCFVVVIASFVTIVQLLVTAFLPQLNDSLGLFIPLIVVNCIVLGRAEGYASKNGPMLSFCDGIGNGIGFTVALAAMGLIREFIGAGTLFDIAVLPDAFPKTIIMIMAPGAFFTYAVLMAAFKSSRKKAEAKKAAKEAAA